MRQASVFARRLQKSQRAKFGTTPDSFNMPAEVLSRRSSVGGMMRIAAACAIGLALMMACSGLRASDPDTTVPSWTADGRFGSNCGMPQGGTDKAYCLVPFARLIALPERYHKKRIVVFGFLIKDHDIPCLYASRDRWLALAPDECVYLPPSAISGELAAALARGVQVSVAGEFDAHFEGPLAFLGRFAHVDVIGSIEPRSSGAEP